MCVHEVLRDTRRLVIVVLLAVSVGVGCAQPPAADWLPDANEAPIRVHGGVATVEDIHGTKVGGELIAIHEDSLFVATDRGLHAISLPDVVRAEVWYFKPEIGGIVGATVTGSLSTISHGVILVFTAPMWFVGGILIAADESRSGRVRWGVEKPHKKDLWTFQTRSRSSKSDGSWNELRSYARFPQGIPASMNRAQIRAASAANR